MSENEILQILKNIKAPTAAREIEVADNVPPEVRSRIMASVRSENTEPERNLRSALHRLGLRFRLHDKTLPGSPDIVFGTVKVAVQVRGCFWHSHGCPRSSRPASRQEYWLPKLDKNRRRDLKNDRQLRSMGWKVLVVWECRMSQESNLRIQTNRIAKAVRGTNPARQKSQD